jgi:hypothetical protein
MEDEPDGCSVRRTRGLVRRCRWTRRVAFPPRFVLHALRSATFRGLPLPDLAYYSCAESELFGFGAEAQSLAIYRKAS